LTKCSIAAWGSRSNCSASWSANPAIGQARRFGCEMSGPGFVVLEEFDAGVATARAGEITCCRCPALARVAFGGHPASLAQLALDGRELPASSGLENHRAQFAMGARHTV